MGRALAHIQQQWHINHGQEIYCVKLASSVSMLDADRVCSSDRGVVSHLSMPPLVLAACASNLFFFFFFSFFSPSAFLRSLFCKIKTSPSPWVESGRLGLVHQRCKLFTTCVVGSLLYGGERKVRASNPTPKTAQLPFRERGKSAMKHRQIQGLPGASHFLVTGSQALEHQGKISMNVPGKMHTGP